MAGNGGSAERALLGDISLLEAMPQPHVLLEPLRDADGAIVDFVYRSANLAACEFNHVPRSVLIGARLLAMHPNVVDAGLFDRYIDVVERGQPFELCDWGYPQEVLGGTWRYYDVHAVAANGCVSQLWTDVTERHLAVEQLHESERRYRLLAENASEVVFEGNNEGFLQWISPQTTEVVGWRPEELVGRPIAPLVHSDDLAELRRAQALLLAGRPAQLRLRLQTRAGDYRWLAVVVKPLFDDAGRVIGRAGSWTDISDVVAARDEAQAQRQQVRATLDAQIDPFILLAAVRDDSGRIIDLEYREANQAALEYNQATYQDLIGARLLQRYPGQLEEGPLRDYFHTIETGEPTILDDYAYRNEVVGQRRHYDIRAVKCGDGIALTWRDVTDRSRFVEELADSERRYRLLAENASDVIWEVGSRGEIVWASESTALILGWPVDQVRGQQALHYVHPDDVPRARDAGNALTTQQRTHDELRLRRADGSYVWVALTARGMATPGGRSRVVALRDIDAEVSARLALASRAGRDPLTALITRERFERQLSEELVTGGPDRVSVLCVGLDSLSRVNDAYTHAAGDAVLAALAQRLVDEIDDSCLVARGTGAEFLVLVPDATGVTDVRVLAERLRAVAHNPVRVGHHEVAMTVSIGIASGQADLSPRELVRAATLAMRSAKDSGRDRITFSTQALADAAERWLTMSESVNAGLRAAQIVAWFQPIHDLATRELRGYEALVRWVKADGTVISPADFLPVAEHSDLITRIDISVMRQGLRALDRLPAPLFVSLNVSARSLRSTTYEAALVEALARVGQKASRVHLEVTETDLVHVSEEITARMERIADLAGGWYIDDFGTGYSSISHLRDLPVRGIKLDTSFSAGIQAGESRTIRLAQALAGLGEGLELDTIAEGVETESQLQILAAQGWRYAQGWLFGRPGPLP